MTTNTSKNDATEWGACLGLVLGILLVIPLIILLAWNYGVVPTVAASGGDVAGINYGAALGLSFVFLLLRALLPASKGRA